MNNWWQSRAPRERLVLAGGMAAVLVALLYALVWEPLHEALAQRQQTIQDQRVTLQWMQEKMDELEQLRAQVPHTDPSTPVPSLLGVLESSARAAGLRERITRMEPAGENRVQVSLRNASFDRSLQWMIALQERYGIEADENTMSAADRRGEVNATILFRR